MNILEDIAVNTRIRVWQAKKVRPLDVVKEEALSSVITHDFPFEQALRTPDVSFICECKKASPSKGVISRNFNCNAIATEYEKAGASAISVLTEPRWFLGSDENLRLAAQTVKVPLLRKDFVVDEYMIYEAKNLGASAVLLICAILDDKTLTRYLSICDELGLSALTEAQNEREIRRAVGVGARVIGVNNRDLRDFTVNLATSKKLRSLVPKDRLFVAESGIRTITDVMFMRDLGADAVLVGEALMRSKDKAKMLSEFRAAGRRNR